MYRRQVVEVPVTEYRRRLAHYHAIAREGEPVYVTERGKPAVRVVSADEGAVLERLFAEGRAQRPRRPRTPLPEPVAYDGPPAEEQIAEDRR
jgi:prevent-host-death family protein